MHTKIRIAPPLSKIDISTTMKPIELALAALESQGVIDYSATAREFGVDRTTLSRRHRGLTSSRDSATDSCSLLTKQQQKELVTYINNLTAKGLPPTHSMVRNFAQDICKKRPGKNWVYRWVKAQENSLSSGFLQGADLDRKKADNLYQYQLYFELV